MCSVFTMVLPTEHLVHCKKKRNKNDLSLFQFYKERPDVPRQNIDTVRYFASGLSVQCVSSGVSAHCIVYGNFVRLIVPPEAFSASGQWAAIFKNIQNASKLKLTTQDYIYINSK